MARSEPVWVRPSGGTAPSSTAEAPFVDPSAGIHARIEKVEVGTTFLVVTGWAAKGEGSAIDAPLTIEVDGVRHPLTGLFPRADLAAQGISSDAVAFLVDVPRPNSLAADAPIALLMGDAIIATTAFEPVRARSFKPTASFDEVSEDTVSGWVFDPELWHGEQGAPVIELTIGTLRLTLPVDIRRFDLPFCAARSGRPMGFQIAPLRAIREVHGVAAVQDVAGQSVRISLVSQGYHLASAMLRLPRVIEPQLQDPQPTPEAARAAAVPDVGGTGEPDGFVDFYGYSAGLGGWVWGGWIRNEAIGDGLDREQVYDQQGRPLGEGLFATHPRADVADLGRGLLGFVPGPLQPMSIEALMIGGERPRLLNASTTIQSLSELDVVNAARQLLRNLPDMAGNALGKTLARPIYEGVDTLTKLPVPVFFEVDEVILAGEEGVMLAGWHLDPTASVKAIRLRTGAAVSTPLTDRWLKLDRGDIRDAFSSQFGLDRADFGFHAYTTLPGIDAGDAYAEVELTSGEIAFKPLPAPNRAGKAGIVRMLSGLHLTADTVRDACARVLGPPVVAINRVRMAERGTPTVIAAGALPERPRCSMVVPLYGRLDFMMYQMALMSEYGMQGDELVYVLDQPERKSEFLALARSSVRRYGVPARLVLPPENLGFAGASNAGMDAARGDYVCFLNSDVMPIDGDWMTRLVDAMEADPTIGVLGARLLFEDDTVQHAGMAMKRLPTFGNMPFPYHPGKGRVSRHHDGVRRVPLVTGALLVMRRELATTLGGFDTDYVIGDFEDADLCMKIRAKGLDCAVHDGVVLYHLERQSQGSAANAWRQNLTLVNAWTFADRWEHALGDVPVEDDLVPLQ